MKLRFPEPLESEFQRDHARKSLLTVRAALVLWALLYAAFGFVDAWALPETREWAFRIRFTGARVKGGMGLFVSHQIVEEHGGRIRIESEIGRARPSP